jgi:hypothetical protein
MKAHHRGRLPRPTQDPLACPGKCPSGPLTAVLAHALVGRTPSWIGDAMARLAWVFCAVFLVSTAHAATSLPRPDAGIPLPPEWQGVWVSVDSVYSCTDGSLIKVVVRLDTLCAGQDVSQDPNAPEHVRWDTCSGSADATQIHEHCSSAGSALCGEACVVNFTEDLDATRTGDTAHWVSLTQAVSTCQATICEWCTLTHRHATRVAPGPCGPVPTQPSTWGRVRATYR